MVVESIIKPVDAERKPWSAFGVGVLFASVSLWLAYSIFPSNASVLMVAFVTIAAVPMMYKALGMEEDMDERIADGKEKLSIIERHYDIISLYTFFFLGTLIAFIFWYIVLPSSGQHYLLGMEIPTDEVCFREQINVLVRMGVVSGSVVSGNVVSGFTVHDISFNDIILNNLFVLFLCFFTSFLFGSGAIFLLTWQASVIGAFIGAYACHIVASMDTSPTIIHYLMAATYVSLSLVVHGVPEILAYFLGAIAGGIFSRSIVRDLPHLRKKYGKYKEVIKDITTLILIAVLLIIIAGVLEVWL